MRALITGSAGFVGRHLIRSLMASRHSPIAFDLYHRDDVRDYDQVRHAILYNEPDLIFHLAAVSWPRESISDPRLCMGTNVDGALNVLEAVRNTGSHARVLLAGTSEEYGYRHHDGQVLTEESACLPDTPYGVSKFAAGMLGLAYARRYGMPVTVTRAFNHTGPGRQAVNAESAFARRIVAVERGNAETVEHGDLSSVRNLSDVRDVVRAYRQVITLEPGVYNICADVNVTMQQVMDILIDLSVLQSARLKQDPHLGSKPEAGFPLPSHEKLTRACGWRPEVPLTETLKDLLAYWRQR